ncbi:lipopolysaccharide biosynthesis protein [Luteithermobacter gelatinilyticus]|uniref:lipopolysaccharide biosynthesis protein n=1 Tax=Luteithermobacter gelatinilyticus TaxID=2582913 RepID=UPI00143CFE55|nr:lipopolysaccharide biosynthesis protein [Luteithermobacter gelatinilyticus]
MKGTIWYVAMRWGIRLLGFVSSAVLARLLMPEDFGLVAIVLVVSGLVSLLFEFGVNMALIQNNKAEDSHFNTAWTIRLFQSCAVAALLVLVAPFIADYYEDSRVAVITYFIAAGTALRGLQNIGIIKFQKDMNFGRDFMFNVLTKLLSILVTIGLAFYYRSYMALVLGTVWAGLVSVALSYVFISYRPCLTLEKWREIWGFSQWVLIRNIAQYFSQEGDKFILASLVGPVKMGFYKWGTELSFMTISEVQQPFSRALVPGLAKIKDNHPRLIAAYLQALNAMTFIAVPVALGFGAVAEEFIPLFLGGGDKWMPVVPLVEGLVFFAMLTAMYGISGSMLTISGNVKYTAYMFWIQAIVTLSSIYPAYQYFGLEGVAYSRALIGVVMFFVVSMMVVMTCQVRWSRILDVVWRPVIAGVTMYFVLISMTAAFTIPSWQLLFLKILAGIILYPLMALSLWWLSGMPATFEKRLTQQIKLRLTFGKTKTDYQDKAN